LGGGIVSFEIKGGLEAGRNFLDKYKPIGKVGVYILHVVDANNVSIETKQIVLE
jgi:O-acetylhomoserine/O-acetylserine sulfhydrylase-like pyridoxal-dependent enzyme